MAIGYEEADKAAGWLELFTSENQGTLFCSSPYLQKHLSKTISLQKINGGWVGKVSRENIIFQQPEKFNTATKVRQGDPLLPEEERLLVIWQSDGSIVASSEDKAWKERFEGVTPFMQIKRPGGDTYLWRLPGDILEIKNEEVKR